MGGCKSESEKACIEACESYGFTCPCDEEMRALNANDDEVNSTGNTGNNSSGTDDGGGTSDPCDPGVYDHTTCDGYHDGHYDATQEYWPMECVD